MANTINMIKSISKSSPSSATTNIAVGSSLTAIGINKTSAHPLMSFSSDNFVQDFNFTKFAANVAMGVTVSLTVRWLIKQWDNMRRIRTT
jgi:RecA/RadA recombinase